VDDVPGIGIWIWEVFSYSITKFGDTHNKP
jgi:hypothetical protein